MSFWCPNKEYLDDWTRIILFGSLFLYLKNVYRPSSIIDSVHVYYRFVPSKWIYTNDNNSIIMRYVFYCIFKLCDILKVEVYQIVRILEIICKLFWIFVIFGFMTVYSLIIMTLCVFVLYGLTISIKGMQHSKHTMIATFFALIFSSIKPGVLSVDYYISNVEYNPNGFGLKLAQVFLVYSLASAGFIKLRLSGIQWLTGKTLFYFMHYGNVKKLYDISPLFTKYKILFPTAAISSIIFEISVI